jgi:hypothetical protein
MATPIAAESLEASSTDPHKLPFSARRALFAGGSRSTTSLGSAMRSPQHGGSLEDIPGCDGSPVRPSSATSGKMAASLSVGSASEKLSQQLSEDGRHTRCDSEAWQDADECRKKARGSSSSDSIIFDYSDLELPAEGDPLGENFEDFYCKVVKLPFGVQICQSPNTWARVESVMAAFPAHQAGVLEGDFLVQVAGKAVSSDTWYLAMQRKDSPLPIELYFRRPIAVPQERFATSKSEGESRMSQEKSNATSQQCEKTPAQLAMIRDAMKSAPVFMHIAEQHVDKVIAAFRGPLRVAECAEVFRQDDSVDGKAPGLFLLEEGSAEAFAVKAGQEHPGNLISTFSCQGQTFGHLALLYDCPRTATVVAKSDLVLWHLDRDSFQQYIDSDQLAGIVEQHTRRIASAGFDCKSLSSGFSIFDVNLCEGLELQDNLRKYYNFCKESSDLSCTVACFSVWNASKKKNEFAKLIPAVPSSSSDNVRIFFFDDNIESEGKASSPGIVNLRNVETGEFVEFGEGVNGFSRGQFATNTIVHHSSEYRNVLVQANILDAMEDEMYFDAIVERHLKHGEKAICFMDVNSTILSMDSASSKDMGQLVLGTMFEFITLQPREPFAFEWPERPPVRVEKAMHLKKLAKEVCKEDKALYKGFYTFENCMKLLSSVASQADLKWSLQEDVFSVDEFKRQYNRYLVSLVGGTNEDGIAKSWFKFYNTRANHGHCTMLNTFGLDGRKVIIKTVSDERQVLHFASCYTKWEARDVEAFEKIYGLLPVV